MPKRKEFGNMDWETKNKTGKKYLSMGIAIGLCCGVAYGLLTDQLAVGSGVGLCLGISFGNVIQQKKNQKQR